MHRSNYNCCSDVPSFTRIHIDLDNLSLQCATNLKILTCEYSFVIIHASIGTTACLSSDNVFYIITCELRTIFAKHSLRIPKAL